MKPKLQSIISQPVIVICGEPGGGKTKEATIALAISSKLANLFANQVYSPTKNSQVISFYQTTSAGIRKCAAESALLLVLDDNGSISKVCMILRIAGFEVLIVQGGSHCVDRVRAD